MKKITFWLLIGLCGIALIYLLLDIGDAKEIMKNYSSLRSHNSSSHGKQLQFLRSYSLQTNDFSVASLILGMSPEEAKNSIGNGGGNGAGGGSIGQVGFTTSMTPDGWRDALSKRNADYFSDTAGFKFVNHNGSTYLVEIQGDYWSKVKAQSSGETVKSVGCWLFACTNSINNLLGSTYGVNDILLARNSSDKVEWIDNQKLWDKGLSSRSLNQRGLAAEKPMFNSFGCDMAVISEAKMTAREAYDKIDNSGFNNCVYIIYGHKSGVLSSGNNHWLVVVGLTRGSSDSEKGFQLLGNSNRGDVKTVNEIGNQSGVIDRIYKITKK